MGIATLSADNKVIAKKIVLAVFSLGLLACFIIYKMEIEMTLKFVVLGLAACIGVVLVVVCMAAVGQSFNQFMLRHGATDAQWFYFNSEPKGLVQMREQMRSDQGK